MKTNNSFSEKKERSFSAAKTNHLNIIKYVFLSMILCSAAYAQVNSDMSHARSVDMDINNLIISSPIDKPTGLLKNSNFTCAAIWNVTCATYSFTAKQTFPTTFIQVQYDGTGDVGCANINTGGTRWGLSGRTQTYLAATNYELHPINLLYAGCDLTFCEDVKSIRVTWQNAAGATQGSQCFSVTCGTSNAPGNMCIGSGIALPIPNFTQ